MYFFRSMKWLRNLGRNDLVNHTPERLYKKYRVCEDHFEDDQFMNMVTKNRLIPFAVPTIVDLPMLTPELFSIKGLLPEQKVAEQKQEVAEEKPEICKSCGVIFNFEITLTNHLCVQPDAEKASGCGSNGSDKIAETSIHSEEKPRV